MLAAGIKTPVPLEELEIHLREEIEQQMKAGLNGQKAFEISTRQTGEPQSLKIEFKKSERTFMKTLKFGGGILITLIGAVLIVPGLVQLRNELAVDDEKLALLLVGWALIGVSLVSIQRQIRPDLFHGKFEKVEMTPLKQTLKIGAGIAGALIGADFLSPAAAQACHAGRLDFAAFSSAVFGVALLLTGAVVACCPYKRRMA